MRYCSLEFADAEGEDRLAQLLAELDAERGTQGNRVYYLAVPPSAIGDDRQRDRRAPRRARAGRG